MSLARSINLWDAANTTNNMYITKAYIELTDRNTSWQAIMELKSIGYDTPYLGAQSYNLAINQGKYAVGLTSMRGLEIKCNDYTPNGTEEEAIKLFIELAKMEDKKRYVGQWRKKGREFFKLTDTSIDSYWCIQSKVLSPKQLALAYKNNNIKL